jgi:hypothetical protein
LSFALLKRAEKREAEEQSRVERLRACPSFREALGLAESFVALVRKQVTYSFTDWLAQVEQSGCVELVGFAAGLRQDETAVRAALTTPWSNGPVEGQVNRLKVIKRQMYGRAGLRLLRARVVNAACGKSPVGTGPEEKIPLHQVCGRTLDLLGQFGNGRFLLAHLGCPAGQAVTQLIA